MRNVISIAALCFATTSVTAQDVSQSSGWYGSVFLGVGTLDGLDDTRSQNDRPLSLGFGTGGTGGITFGRRIHENWRLEAELSHSSNALSSGSYDATPFDFQSGTLSTTYLFANIWYDVPSQGKFRPYVGGGLGAGFSNPDFTFSDIVAPNENQVNLAVQFGLGVTVPLQNRLSLDIGYRVKAIPSLDLQRTRFDGSVTTYSGGSSVSQSLQISLNMQF